MIKRAVISVSDKTGIMDFAAHLHRLGVEIVSTGGTLKLLREAGIPVTYVGDVTGFPEIMDGRVKTLHPKIHGGILARRNNPGHRAQMAEHGIVPIDLVVVNLYPFRETVAKPHVTEEEAVEQIDIGGPSMIRAAAKNFAHVAVVVNPAQYPRIVAELAEYGAVQPSTRRELAREAFLHTSEYDAAIYRYLAGREDSGFPAALALNYTKIQGLRYGENPHQRAAFYGEPGASCASVAKARQLHGKELSFNNIVDLDAALALVREFAVPAAVIVKHTNPCGTACGSNLEEACRKAFAADPVSAFGGIIGFNREVDETTARAIGDLFVEAIIAPGYSDGALNILTAKKNLRLLDLGRQELKPYPYMDIKRVSGGLLLQDGDVRDPVREEMAVVTRRRPAESEWADLLFAWKVVKHVKSNAIVVAKDLATLGVGAGQRNRGGAARIALEQAGNKARGAVLASDAFFPFRDTVDAAGEAGITAIIQPGGSVRDEESITAADAHGIAMVFTGLRHFKH